MGPTIEKKPNVQIPKCKYQSADYSPTNAKKANGPNTSKETEVANRNIHNICSVQRQIRKLFSKLKKMDKLKVHKKNLTIQFILRRITISHILS